MELKHLNWIISRESSQWSAAQKFSCVLALQRIVFVDKMFISEIKSATAYTKKKKNDTVHENGTSKTSFGWEPGKKHFRLKTRESLIRIPKKMKGDLSVNIVRFLRKEHDLFSESSRYTLICITFIEVLRITFIFHLPFNLCKSGVLLIVHVFLLSIIFS